MYFCPICNRKLNYVYLGNYQSKWVCECGYDSTNVRTVSTDHTEYKEQGIMPSYKTELAT